MQVRVVAEKFIKEENLPALKKLLPELLEETRKEDGCLEYTFNQDQDNPEHFTFIETWENMEKLKAHTQTPHYKEIVPQINKLGFQDGVLKLYHQLEL